MMKKKGEIIEWDRLEISKKIGDTKETFQANIGTRKDKNGKDLRQA